MKSLFTPTLATGLLVAFLLAATAPRARGQIIHVPQDQPTIAQGIAAALPGWTVLVAPGTYSENMLSFGGKPILLAGEDPNDPPVIEPGQASAFFLVESGETPATEIRDLVIRNLDTFNAASAIEIRGSSAANAPRPLFRNVRVENCRAAVNSGSACVVCNLPFPSGQPYDGPTFVDCDFIGNGFKSAIPNANQFGVVGIGHSKVSFTRCQFIANEGLHSPALYSLSCDLTMVDCLIAENTATAPPSAMTLSTTLGATQGGTPQTGDIINCTIAGNTQVGFMGLHEDTAIRLSEAGVSFQNTVVAENEYLGTQTLTAQHQIDDQGQTVLSSFDRCCITTGAASLSNTTQLVTASPLFVGSGLSPIDRYRLTAASPCIDAGAASPQLSFFDLAGAFRFQGPNVDLGALEGAFNAAPLLPGSGEDLVLDLALQGMLASNETAVAAAANDTMNLHLRSPGASFVNRVPILVAQVIPNGQSPGNPVGFPEVWVVPNAQPAPLILFDGNAQTALVGPTLLSVVGLSLNAVLSPSLIGIDFVVQGLALDAAAANGFFASSEAYLVEVN
jgi:hypothetical protein